MNTLTADEMKQIRGMEESALIAAVGDAINKVSRDIAMLAAMIQELAHRQSDRSSHICRSGIWIYLPLVASGQVSPRVMATFAHQEELLAAVSQLPIEEQDRICSEGASFEVNYRNPLYGKAGQPEFDKRCFLPYLLPTERVHQVIDVKERRLRNEAEQIAFLISKENAKAKSNKVKTPTIKTDSEHLLVYVDGKPIRFAAIVDAISQIVSERPDAAKTVRDAIRRLPTVNAR